MKKFIATFMAAIITVSCTLFTSNGIVKPVEASAAFHIDFWNWEKNCCVAYECVGYDCFKVLVSSDESRTLWSNNVSYVPYWYTATQLEAMVGYEPTRGGAYYCYTDVKKSLLEDTNYFASFHI